jgi:hypothetical protein
MASARPNDYDDPDNKPIFRDGAHLPSPAMARLNAAITKGVEIWRADREKNPELHREIASLLKAIGAMRAHLRPLNLTPSRLRGIISLSWSTAAQRHDAWSGKDIPADQPLKSGLRTHGEWRDAAWLVTRAAWAEMIASKYRPGTPQDLIELLGLCQLNGSIVPTREGGRFQRRMKRYLANVVDGLPFDYGIYPKAGEVRAAKKPARRTNAKAPRAVVVAAFAGKRRATSGRAAR